MLPRVAEMVGERTLPDYDEPPVVEDRIWNLVLACQQCNSEKGDRIPAEICLSKLRERNARLLELLASGALADQRDERRDLQEFASRNLDAHIRMLVDACREDDFGVWEGVAGR